MLRVTRVLVAVGMLAAAMGTSLGGRLAVPAGADSLPVLRVGSATVIEGDTGSAVVNVPVDLSTTTTVPVTFRYTISGDASSNTATAGQDFLARTGLLKMAAGTASKQVSVHVLGDTAPELDEHVAVTISAPINATIGVANGGVTIIDDDHDANTGLQASIGDVTITEADGGTHTASIPITLSQPAPSTVKVHYGLDCGNAVDGNGQDYVAKQSGTLTFAKGKQSLLLNFTIVANQTPEDAKAFLDTISVTFGPATVNQRDGGGTIIDDDSPTGTPNDPATLGVGELGRVSVASDGSEATYPPTGVCYSDNSTFGSTESVVNADGRYIAFRSDAPNLVPGDTNLKFDIFVHDRIAGTTERVSVMSDGTQAPANVGGAPYYGADNPSISADGRYVTFWSPDALVAGMPSATGGIFLHDRVTGQTELISQNVDGTADTGVVDVPAPVSADGRYVAFESGGSNLVAGDTDPSTPGDGLSTYDVFVRDRVTGTNTLVSVGYDGSAAAGQRPAMSSDGRYVAFLSQTETMVPGDTNGCRDVYVRDMVAGTIQRVNLTNSGDQELAGLQGCGFQFEPAISGDGSTVAWVSPAWNTFGLSSAPDMNHLVGYHLYVRNLPAATTQRVDDVPVGGGAAVKAWHPALSTDGNLVGYDCACNEGAPQDAYVYDRTLDTRLLVGDLPDGTLADAANYATPNGALSADGNYMVFDSWATNLLPGGADTNEVADVYIERLG